MARNNRPVIIGAVLLGVLALALTLYSVLGGRGGAPGTPAPGTPAPAAPRVTQLVSKVSIPPRTRITPDMAGMFDTREIAAPADGAPSPAFTSFEDIQGRLVTEPIYPGRPIARTAMTEAVGRVTPANFEVQDNLLPANSRAIAVMVDPKATMGGLVDVGDRVDVIVVHALKYRSTASGIEGNARSGRTIGQNLLVLATDDALKKAQTPPAGAAAPGATGTAAGAAPPPPPPPPPNPNAPAPKVRVVLAAPPAIAERIAAAQEQGNIHLSLRPPTSPEQFPVPEAVEYPVRPGPDPAAVARAERLRTEAREDRRAALAATRDERNQRAARAAMITARAQGGGGGQMRMPDPTIRPMPTTDTAPPPPPPPTGSEITVIRGTEKTRVLVPGR